MVSQAWSYTCVYVCYVQYSKYCSIYWTDKQSYLG